MISIGSDKLLPCTGGAGSRLLSFRDELMVCVWNKSIMTV